MGSVGSEDDLQKRMNSFTNFSKANNGMLQKADQSSMEQLAIRNGCIILGKDAGRGNKYTTRFKIERSRQRELADQGKMFKEYCPCCVKGANHSARKFMWNLIRAEAFVLSLHMSVLVLGVMKEALNLRTVDEDLHLIHSVIETFVSCVVVVIRIASTRHGVKELHEKRESNEVVGSTTNIEAKDINREVTIFTVFAISLILADWAAFFMFMYIPGANLGWTILSNNTVLLFGTVFANHVGGRISSEMAQINQDHHKAVIYETVLLLTESAMAQTREEKIVINDKVEKFCKALRDTDLFKQPDYITCPEDIQPHWDTITSMEMISMV